jgi:hypothetical protein
MKLSVLLRCFLFIGAMLFRYALADLSSVSYARAKEAYKSEDWATAGKLLRNYLNEDHDFLAKNPAVAKQISVAIAFCDHVVTIEKRSIGSVSAEDDATAPALP